MHLYCARFSNTFQSARLGVRSRLALLVWTRVSRRWLPCPSLHGDLHVRTVGEPSLARLATRSRPTASRPVPSSDRCTTWAKARTRSSGASAAPHAADREAASWAVSASNRSCGHRLSISSRELCGLSTCLNASVSHGRSTSWRRDRRPCASLSARTKGASRPLVSCHQPRRWTGQCDARAVSVVCPICVRARGRFSPRASAGREPCVRWARVRV